MSLQVKSKSEIAVTFFKAFLLGAVVSVALAVLNKYVSSVHRALTTPLSSSIQVYHLFIGAAALYALGTLGYAAHSLRAAATAAVEQEPPEAPPTAYTEENLRAALASIEATDLQTEGLYRVGPNGDSFRQLESSLSNTKNPAENFGKADPHEKTRFVKNFFRDNHRVIDWSTIKPLPFETKQERATLLNKVMTSLPTDQDRKMLRLLLAHCVKVTENVASNQMTAFNLGVVFAPNLITYNEHSQEHGLDAINNRTMPERIEALIQAYAEDQANNV